MCIAQWMLAEYRKQNYLPQALAAREIRLVRIEVIQHAVYCEFSQHDRLLNTQQCVALRSLQRPREITRHDVR